MYTTSHAWLSRQEDALWRVGLTGFAVRVLGEPVEFDIEAKPGAPLEVGQTIGWIEGFKAVTDLFCPMAGVFQSANPELAEEISLLHCDPYGRGWLYLVEGAPDRDCFDVDGYASFLDTTIDRMSGATHGHG